jgi:hypothetical protein
MIVIVVEPKEFDQWKASQETLIQREPGLLKYVSEDLKELARIKSGLTDIQDKESESVSVAGSNK